VPLREAFSGKPRDNATAREKTPPAALLDRVIYIISLSTSNGAYFLKICALFTGE